MLFLCFGVLEAIADRILARADSLVGTTITQAKCDTIELKIKAMLYNSKSEIYRSENTLWFSDYKKLKWYDGISRPSVPSIPIPEHIYWDEYNTIGNPESEYRW